ncbi:DNA mismatch repair protein MutS [Ruminococcus sp.]|uniref:MutS-related protein n=1 Tax=Ruminococcus sp. TaxID=41978 RepID=UPI0025F1337B|nr:DNA mismatch repair protein MutS [Ruminococcus sp.]MBQ8966740.1 DNA mismatch repair protein MutS [Ruminococcus sp.]
MKHDEIEQPNRVADLFYPDEAARERMKKRRFAREGLPKDYLKDLELEKVADMFTREDQLKLIRLFEELCDEPEIIAYRQDILEDFLNIPRLAPTIKKLVDIMVENDRGNIYQLSEPDSFSSLSDAIRAFDAYVECVELMHRFYDEHKGEIGSAGVHKLFDYFEKGYADEDFNNMKRDLSELETALKNHIRSVTVAVNLDENLVPVAAGIVDMSSEKYILKPSLLDRILYRGAKFPEKTVENMHKKFRNDDEIGAGELLVNTVDETLFRELDSFTRKLVKKLTKVMAEYQKLGVKDIFSINYQLQFYMGAAALIESARSKGLDMCRPEILPVGERKAEITGLFDLVYYHEASVYNLRAKEDKKSVVTNDISFDDEGRFFILTGANNGGKTTFVRGLGICQVLAQAGFYVPAKSCRISPVDAVYTHFPREEETGINTSRFTTEVKEFRTISDTITNHSLLLMNESIQSTTPVECVEIASRLVRIFCILGVRGIFATHLTDIALGAKRLNTDPELHSRVQSLTVTVGDNGERRYKVVKGLPDKNVYAGEIFEKFGISEADILSRAKAFFE